MSSGFRHWIWYAIHSNNSFSGECEQPKLNKARNEKERGPT